MGLKDTLKSEQQFKSPLGLKDTLKSEQQFKSPLGLKDTFKSEQQQVAGQSNPHADDFVDILAKPDISIQAGRRPRQRRTIIGVCACSVPRGPATSRGECTEPWHSA